VTEANTDPSLSRKPAFSIFEYLKSMDRIDDVGFVWRGGFGYAYPKPLLYTRLISSMIARISKAKMCYEVDNISYRQGVV
jgi:hypothetical protein